MTQLDIDNLVLKGRLCGLLFAWWIITLIGA